jgi:hypothetical protein
MLHLNLVVDQISFKGAELNGGMYLLDIGLDRSLIARDSFAALNPHGALDFYLPGEGNISEYVGMWIGRRINLTKLRNFQT